MVKFFAVLVVLGVFSAPSAVAGTAAENGIAAYNGHNYGVALTSLKQAIQANPKNESARYYLALTCQALSRSAEAEKEYRWLYQHGKSGTLKMKAYQGLLALSSRGAAARSTFASQASSGGVSTNVAASNEKIPPGWLPAGAKIYEAKKEAPARMDTGFVRGCGKR